MSPSTKKIQIVTDRVKILLSHLEDTPSEVAYKLGHSDPRKVYNVIHDKNQATLRLILELLDTYPDISIDWLLTGEGELWK